MEVYNLEFATREQSGSGLWHIERKYRLSSSTFGDICNMTERRDIQKLCQSLFNPPELHTPAVVHGRLNEGKARTKFQEVSSLKVEKCGLFVHDLYPNFCASPDGIISSENAVLEIKSPYSGKDAKIEVGPLFPYLCQEQGRITLKRNHKYYYQIQGQMGLARKAHCYFVVHTAVDIYYVKIDFDQVFFDNMIEKLGVFFSDHYVKYVAAQL